MQQRFDESFYEAWDRFNDMLRACLHPGFSELHQLATFYNSLNVNDQDSLNSAVGGNFLDKMPRECLKIIKRRSKLKQLSRIVLLAVVPTRTKIVQLPTEMFIETTSKRSGTLPSNTITNPKEELKVSVPMPNLKSSILYLSRRNNERRRDQANEQIEKFYEIFKDMSFEISFTNALILTPKFASTLKALIGNKEKLSEMARTPMNEHCLTVILNKFPRKLGDPGKFLIPCEFPGMNECLALADLGASINFMPLSVWEELLLLELTPTCMTPELMDRLVSKPIGITKDVSVKGELTLRIKNEAITYNLDQTSRYSANYNQMTANKIDVVDLACEEYSQEVLSFSNGTASGNPTPHDDLIVSITSPTLTPFGDTILNSEPLPPLPNHEQYMPSFKKELKVFEAKTVKSFVDEPPEVELKDFPPHLEYAFLEGENKLPIIIVKELGDEEKSALIKSMGQPGTLYLKKVVSPLSRMRKLVDSNSFGYRMAGEDNVHLPIRHVCLSSHAFRFVQCTGTFQRCMLAIFHDMVEKMMEVFMDDFLVFGNSFEICRSRLDKMLQRKGNVSRSVCIRKIPVYLIMNKSIVHTGHSALKYLFAKKDAKARLLRWVLLLQEFDFKVLDTKEAENLAANHLSRLENLYENMLDPKEKTKTFPLETLSMVSFRGDSSAPWFADFANYHSGNFIIKAKKLLTLSKLATMDLHRDIMVPTSPLRVTHHLSIAYHSQTSGQVKVSNRGLKRILERTIGENRASWSDKLDDALWAFRTAYKTPIRCTPYKLVYGKACHLPIDLEHKAYSVLKQVNFDLAVAGDHQKVQLNELRDHAYENSLIYKEKTKRIHDSKIKNYVFNVGDRVLLFNSRLNIFLGKLKTHWSGPFTITKVFPYGMVELSQANGPNFKVNGHRIKHYFGGDVPQLEMDTQEKDKNKAKNDKTKHGMEKIEKDKVIRS
nr:reverse transcriptase domain-containing protein [Tanacetum cinerariifolium]